MFEVFNSVQIKPFCLKIGINNTKNCFQSLCISWVMTRFAAFCKTYHKTIKLTDFSAFKMFKFLGHFSKNKKINLWIT